jgi:predicted regulator of amino acid metabolism with ACT domain
MTADEVGIPLQAFSALLHSDNIATVCRALNMYQVAASYTRLSGGNPLEPLAEDVRQVARKVLSAPPMEADEELRAAFDHLSALNVLTSLAEAEDADLIATIIEDTTDADVRATALLAAAAVPADAKAERLLRVLQAMADDEALDERDRARAKLVREKLTSP